PNVIVVMNEAFADWAVDGDIKASAEYMPFYKSIKENAIKGYAHVSAFGGRTANSEYEFLTGMSMAFYPTGTVPFQHSMKHDMDSFTRQLEDLNYGGLDAVHPFKGSGYNRIDAYEKLGFDRFYTMDDFENPKLLRKYISDEADYEKLFELYEEHENSAEGKKGQPFYIFNVTMQNHGDYATGYDNLPITITSGIKDVPEGANRYLTLIKKSDEALEVLLDYFSDKEPTIVVFFGDHQPSMSDEFYEKLMAETADTQEKMVNRQKVPYMIWANYDISGTVDQIAGEGVDAENISLNYLSTLVTDTAGLPKTGFQLFLEEARQEIPVINAFYYIGKDGKVYTMGDESPYEDIIKKYRYFQY
ncbi:MAG: LTA synthase family protein, partial [Parasporobacterium sp.]|nr:LTA synthase family protein [Parasporobacterium sp.]